MTLAVRLRKERKAKGLSQRDLALACGVGHIAQGNYENGHRVPRADYLCSLNALGFDVHYILTGERLPFGEVQLSASEAAVVRSLRLLDEKDRELIQQLLATLTKGVE
jgi:transcriptional regulator with XRE-family HTH domain